MNSTTKQMSQNMCAVHADQRTKQKKTEEKKPGEWGRERERENLVLNYKCVYF